MGLGGGLLLGRARTKCVVGCEAAQQLLEAAAVRAGILSR